MAVFSKLVTTENGRMLIARMLSGGEKIVFTRICSSDREYDPEELCSLEELADIRQTGSVSKVSRTNDISVKVETVFTNTELTEGYYMRTIALYARGGEGEEILYAAAVETSGNCFMPAFGGTTVSGAYIQLVTTVSNAENVTLEVDNSVFATIGNIAELQEQIDSISELVGGVAARAALNANKLDCLGDLGIKKMSKELKCQDITMKPFRSTLLYKIDETEFKKMDNHTFYYYVLDQEKGMTTFTINMADHSSRELTGHLLVTMYVNGAFAGTSQICPITQCAPYCYTAPLFLAESYGPATLRGVEVAVIAYIFERNDAGNWIDLKDEISISSTARFRVYKMGYILSVVDEWQSGNISGEGSGIGTNNYNLLIHKPSINNITLQGNLTSEQLGLEGGSGSASGMTYKEALAILNEEDEEETGV